MRFLESCERLTKKGQHLIVKLRIILRHGLREMRKLDIAGRIGKAGLSGIVALGSQLLNASAFASPTGDECRKQICNSAVSSCMRADLALVPMARTEAEKQTYCTTFFNGCMTREVTADLPWYTPEMVARFLQCPP
jgi:hypothetical protein